MRKTISFDWRYSLALVALFLFGGQFTARAQWGEPTIKDLVLNEIFTPDPNVINVYDCTQSGKLTFSFMEETNYNSSNPWFCLYEGGYPGANIDPSFCDGTEGTPMGGIPTYTDATVFTFDVEAGQTYCISTWNRLPQCMATFEEDDEVGGGSGILMPADGEALPIGEEFRVAEAEDGITLYFIPTADGILRWDCSNQLYLSAVKVMYDADGDPLPVAASGAANIDDFMNSRSNWAEYNLEGGQTYYFKSTRGPQDTWTFTWNEGAGAPAYSFDYYIRDMEPRDGVSFAGFVSGEDALGSPVNAAITLYLNVENATKADIASIRGNLYNADGELWTQMNFGSAPGDRYFYEFPEGSSYIFYEYLTYNLELILTAADGQEYTKIVTWTGTEVKQAPVEGDIISMNPADGSTIPGLIDGEQFTVKFNPEIGDIAVVSLRIDDSNGKYIGASSSFNNVNGEWVWNIGYTYPFYEGVEYTGVFSLYADQMRSKLLKSIEVKWYGNAPSPKSETVLTSTDPSMDDIISIAADGTVQFSAEFSTNVTINKVYAPGGQGIQTPISTYVAEGNTIQVTVPASIVNEQVDNLYGEVRVVIEATGADGRPVYSSTVSDSGETVNRAYVLVTYTTDREIKTGVDFDVYTIDDELLDGATIEAPLGMVKVSSTENSNEMNPNHQAITVSDAEGNVVARANWDLYNPEEGIVYLTDNVTEAGEYKMFFSQGAFIFGTGMEAPMSAEKTVVFTIKSQDENNAWLYTPDTEGLSSLSAMQVVWGDYAVLTPSNQELNATLDGPGFEAPITVTGKLAWAEKADENPGGVMALADDDMNSLLFQFNPPYTEAGAYTLEIPAGLVLVNGEANEAVTLVYIVKGESEEGLGVATFLSPESDPTGPIMQAIITWNQQEISLGDISGITVKVDNNIYTADELTIDLTQSNVGDEPGIATQEDDATGDALVIGLPFEVYGQSGIYEFYLPEGAVKNADGLVNPEQTLSLTVLSATMATLTIEPACENYSQADVETLSEITLSWDGFGISENDLSELCLELPDENRVYLAAEGLVSYNDDNTAVILNVADYVTEAGLYSLVLPEGAFLIEEMPGSYFINGEGYYTYNVTFVNPEVNEPWLYTPNMEGLSSLSAMQVVWGDYAELTPSNQTIYATLEGPGIEGSIVVDGKLAWAEKSDETVGGTFEGEEGEGEGEAEVYNSLLFQFNPAYTEVGIYTLTIPAGMVLVGETPNEDVTVSYAVVAPLETIGDAVMINPESNIVESITSATFTWDYRYITLTEAPEIMVMTDGENYLMDELQVELITINMDGEPGVEPAAEDDVYGNALVITLPESAEGKTGAFNFVLPEGTVVTEDGMVNPYQMVTVWVLPTSEAVLTITPECGNYDTATVKTLPEITLNWENKEVATNIPCNIRLDNNTTEEQYYLDEEGLLNIEDNTVILSVAALTEEAGEYSLVIPQASFLIGAPNELAACGEYYFTFNVTESTGIINIVDAQDGKYVVYNMNGILVLSTEDGAALSQLEPGLYIINGKKIYVRK